MVQSYFHIFRCVGSSDSVHFVCKVKVGKTLAGTEKENLSTSELSLFSKFKLCINLHEAQQPPYETTFKFTLSRFLFWEPQLMLKNSQSHNVKESENTSWICPLLRICTKMKWLHRWKHNLRGEGNKSLGYIERNLSSHVPALLIQAQQTLRQTSLSLTVFTWPPIFMLTCICLNCSITHYRTHLKTHFTDETWLSPSHWTLMPLFWGSSILRKHANCNFN